MQFIKLLIYQLKKCRECDIDIDIGNSRPDFKLRQHYRKLYNGLFEKFMTCLGDLFNDLYYLNECKSIRINTSTTIDSYIDYTVINSDNSDSSDNNNDIDNNNNINNKHDINNMDNNINHKLIKKILTLVKGKKKFN